MCELVTVVIPTYKRTWRFERALESVINQTYKNLEIIVVDDNCSKEDISDHIQDIICAYSKSFDIKYVKNKINLGGAGSRNVGLGKAKGKYIVFLDDDDILRSYKIEHQINYMIKNDVKISFTNSVVANEKDIIKEIRNHSRFEQYKDEQLLYHLKYHIAPTIVYMFEADLLRKYGGFVKTDISQDYRLILNCLVGGEVIGYLDEYSAIQYVHTDERISTSVNKLNGEKCLFEEKEKFFNEISRKDIRYICFRYYAVLLLYYLRKRSVLPFAKMLMRSIFRFPVISILEAKRVIIIFFRKCKLENFYKYNK